jgi:heat shock protein HslJ
MINKISTLVIVIIFVTSCNVFKCKKDISKLEGSWELNYISGPKIAFDGLYPDKKPTISFNITENQFSGNNSCNSYSGKLLTEGKKIDFTRPIAVTKMMCGDGQGEQTFMSTLEKINTYSISDEGKTLNFMSGDVTMMRFTKK